MKRIVLFVEGEGEAEAAPILVSKLVSDQGGFDCISVDPQPFRIGGLGKLFKNDWHDWRRLLKVAAKRNEFVGALLLLDGDTDKFNGLPFCAMTSARALANATRSVGGGSLFSVACVFACQEFESWFISAAAGFKNLPDGRKLTLPESMPTNPEIAPRDAKGWMNRVVSTGYRPTVDQAVFTRALDLRLLRQNNIRSFVRLENAVKQLIHAVRSTQPIVSPS